MLSTLTSKGQITLPKKLRDVLKLKTGDKVEFLIHDNGLIELLPLTQPLTSLKGMVPKPKQALKLNEMEKAIKEAALDWD